MYECWAWVEILYGSEQYQWVQGFDVGSATLPYKGHVTVFRPLDTMQEEGFSCGFYVEDWQLCYGKEKPTHTGVEFEFINQVLKAI